MRKPSGKLAARLFVYADYFVLGCSIMILNPIADCIDETGRSACECHQRDADLRYIKSER